MPELILGLEAYKSKAPVYSLPSERQDELIQDALVDATGIIVSYLPYLMESGILVVPVELRAGLEAIARDIAFFRMTDSVQDSEKAERRYMEAMRALRQMSEAQQGILDGPNLQFVETVEEGGFFGQKRELF